MAFGKRITNTVGKLLLSLMDVLISNVSILLQFLRVIPGWKMTAQFLLGFLHKIVADFNYLLPHPSNILRDIWKPFQQSGKRQETNISWTAQMTGENTVSPPVNGYSLFLVAVTVRVTYTAIHKSKWEKLWKMRIAQNLTLYTWHLVQVLKILVFSHGKVMVLYLFLVLGSRIS